MDHSISTTTLLCEEDSSILEDSHLDFFPPASHNPTTHEEEQYMSALLKRELIYEEMRNPSPQKSPWIDSARSDAVRWIAKKRVSLRFAFHTAYLAVMYFDLFLLKRAIENRQMWAVKLLSVACLTLAAKLEECHVPVLSEFETDDYHFDWKSIQRMELVVLTTLEWKMRLVTPFHYLSCLISKFECELQPRDILTKASVMLLSAIESMKSIDHQPSVFAISAFLAARGRGLKMESLDADLGFISSDGSSRAEDVISCYNKMQKLRKKTRIGNDMPVNDHNDHSDFVSISTKRKKLDFDTQFQLSDFQ